MADFEIFSTIFSIYFIGPQIFVTKTVHTFRASWQNCVCKYTKKCYIVRQSRIVFYGLQVPKTHKERSESGFLRPFR